MAQATLDRVKKLIALASSSNEEEARTSAVLACRLIREHKLEVREPNGKNESPKDSLEDFIGSAYDWLRKQGFTEDVAESASRAYEQTVKNAAREAYSRKKRSYGRGVHPIDPFKAPFSVTQAYLKSKGVAIHDNGDGSYSAHSGFESMKGAFADVVRFSFGCAEENSRAYEEDR